MAVTPSSSRCGSPRPAEIRTSGQVRRVTPFIAAIYNGEAFTFDLFELRAAVHRRAAPGQSDLHSLVPDGDRRVRAVIEQWGLKWPEAQ